jgi:hypothetical protein
MQSTLMEQRLIAFSTEHLMYLIFKMTDDITQ